MMFASSPASFVQFSRTPRSERAQLARGTVPCDALCRIIIARAAANTEDITYSTVSTNLTERAGTDLLDHPLGTGAVFRNSVFVRELLLLLAIAGSLFVIGLGRLPPLEPDDGRNAV